jgi:hypothetical protein
MQFQGYEQAVLNKKVRLKQFYFMISSCNLYNELVNVEERSSLESDSIIFFEYLSCFFPVFLSSEDII